MRNALTIIVVTLMFIIFSFATAEVMCAVAPTLCPERVCPAPLPTIASGEANRG